MAEQIGVRSIFETKEFKKGLQIYLDGLKKAEKQTDKTSGAAGSAGQGITGGLIPGLSGASRESTLLTGAIAGVAGAIGFKLVSALTDGTRALANFGKEAVLTASRVDELTIVAQILGQRAGFTSEQVSKEVDQIKELGIRTDVALKLVAQFARRELDLADATKLADVARNAAIISMEDTSDALDNILYGILTYNKRVLRTAGLNVDIRGEFDRLAKSVDSTSEKLTEQQKIQAALNGVFREGVKITGLYEAVQAKIPGKQLRSLRRDVFDLSTALGAPFQEAFLTLINTVRDFVQTITAALQPPRELAENLAEAGAAGGELFDLMVNLGAAASIMADGIQWAAGIISEWLVGSLDNLNDKMEDTAQGAFQWGLNIAVELADGLIQGAITFLTWAMNQISALLSHWLSGASPPRVAPDLPKWGANAMAEFLRGFTQADFSTLKAIQQPLQKAIQLLVQTGEIGQRAGGQLFVSISEQLARALSGLGELDPKFFDRLTRSVGPFGAEIANLTRKVLNLARAEEALEKAQKKEESATRKVREGIAEYNELLRAGATEDVLNDRLALINAQEDQAAAAREEKNAAEEQLDALREAVSLQQQLVEQLLMLTQAQIVTPGTGEEAGEDLVDGLAAGLEGLDLSSFSGKWTEAIQAAKQQLLSLFDPIRDKWEQEWDPLFESFGKQWDLFEIEFLTVWYRLFGPERGIITTALKDLDFSAIGEAWGTLIGSLTGLVGAVGDLVGIDTTSTSTFFQSIEDFMQGEAVPFLQNQIELLAQDIESLAEAIDKIADFLPFLFKPFVFGEPSPEDETVNVWELIDAVKELLGIGVEVDEKTTETKRIQRDWGNFMSGELTEGINLFRDMPLAALTGDMGPEGGLWQNIQGLTTGPITELITGLDNTESAIGRVMTKIGEMQEMVANVDWGNLNAIVAKSPAPMAVGLQQVQHEMGRFQSMMSPSPAAVPVVGGASTQNITLNFETVITGDMDEARFIDRVSRIVIKLLT